LISFWQNIKQQIADFFALGRKNLYGTSERLILMNWFDGEINAFSI